MSSPVRPVLMRKLLPALVVLCGFATLQLACGGGGSSVVVQTPVPAGQPTFSHVVLVVEENHGYSEVIGSSSMPYFNSLVSQYGLATQYFANAHPSIPNYLMLTTGLTETFDDNFSGTITHDNVVRELVKAGKTWKAYVESLPSPGYVGADSGPYLRQHNPFIYLSDLTHGGGHVATLIISSAAKQGFQSQTLYQHQSVLRLTLAGSGVTNFPGMAGTARDMTEFFTGH